MSKRRRVLIVINNNMDMLVRSNTRNILVDI